MIPETRRVRIDLAYDGTDFCGWQAQRSDRTVQYVVEKALRELHGGERVPLHGASRTDSGVHAQGQVADALVSVRLDDRNLAYALRRLLPVDVRPLRVETVPHGFNARAQALSKLYRYRVDGSLHGDPFSARYALHLPAALDERAILEALALLPGRRDWTGFTTPRSDKESHIRTLMRAEMVRSDSGETLFEFEGDGFLRYMVRNLVGTLLEIGRGRMPVGRIGEILDSGDHEKAGPTAAAHGLHLVRIRYPDKGCTIGAPTAEE